MIVYIILGLILGGICAWFIASFRLQRRCAEQIAGIQSSYSNQITEVERRVGGSEARVEELRQQAQMKDSEIGLIRNDLAAENQAKVEALTKLDAAQKSFEEQKALIEAMKTEMTATFNALSSAALKSSSEDFLRLASEHLGKVVADTKGRLGEHQAALDGMIKPLYETLKRYDEQIRSIEESRHKAYGSLEEQLKALASTQGEPQERDKQPGFGIAKTAGPRQVGRDAVEKGGRALRHVDTLRFYRATIHGYR